MSLDLNENNINTHNKVNLLAYCDKNPHMLKTASFTSYRAPIRPSLPKHASWINTSRTLDLSPRSTPRATPAHSPRITPAVSPNRSSQRRSFSNTPNRSLSPSIARMGKQKNVSGEPPKHQMVHLPGLMSEVRRFGQFRKVLHTGLYSQLVAMEVPVGGDIGDEVHAVDQILLFTSGKGRATVAGKDQDVKASDVVVVPAGTQHQFVNTGDEPLELLTVYSPAEHDPKTVHKTKEEGDEEEDNGKDEAPEWSRRNKKENEEAGNVKLEGGPYKGE